jgi:hypothetical protein
MYLERARTDASLQPNASINESGPVSRTTSAAPNLILHNLKRVQAGLAGEVLGRDLTVQKQNPGEDYLDVPVPTANEEQGEGEKDDLEMKDVEMETEAEAFAEQEEQSAAVDKEERKRKKKERRLAEKKAKAKKEVDSD